MAKILVTGGSGLIGQALIPQLIKENHQVSILSRSHQNIPNVKVYQWNVKDETVENEAFKNLDYIIHLAGAGIADKRWTEARKKEIIDSRVKSTELLFKKIQEHQVLLKGFIAASAIGYYGAVSSDKEFTEEDGAHDDFLGTVCKLWEDALHLFKNVGIPTTILRTGIVLSNEGGALEKMKTPIISPLGSGKQYMPWIHIEDMSSLYIQALKGELEGTFNAVAPDYQTNYTFSKELAKSLGRPFLPLGVPGFLLKIVFGELAIILLTGSKISAQKLEKSGYKFKHPNLKSALQELANP